MLSNTLPFISVEHVEVRSGYKEKKIDDVSTQVVIICKGKCENVQIYLKRIGEGEVILAASEKEPAFTNEKGCYNCFCVSDHKGSNDKCTNNENDLTFGLRSKKFYFAFIPKKSIKDAVAIVKGLNIESIERYHSGMHMVSYQLSNGPEGMYFILQQCFCYAAYSSCGSLETFLLGIT